eukprot:1464784-Lingulodinium_polyedra.AAC.1
MHFIVAPQAWVESGYGVVLTGKVFTHLIWADNFWLLASTQAHLVSMVSSLTLALKFWNLWWKRKSLCYLTTDPKCETQNVAQCEGIEPLVVPKVQDMEVL